MRFLLEFDGPIANVADAYYFAYIESASQVSWSKLDRATFWRLLRTKGTDADLLPRAPDIKVKDFWQRFNFLLDQSSALQRFTPVEEILPTLSKLTRHGSLVSVTLGANIQDRSNLIKAWKLSSLVQELHPIPVDPRQRPAVLKTLIQGDRRAIVIACSDALIRAADAAEIFTVGLSSGPCGADRLHRAGPRVVFKTLEELAASLNSGATDLIRAGLLPLTPGL